MGGKTIRSCILLGKKSAQIHLLQTFRTLIFIHQTNPSPLEAIIAGHPSVRDAIMFGRAEFLAGVIIDPIEEKRFDPNEVTQLAKFRNEIWEYVERANAFAPKHSRIFKEVC